MALDTTQSAAGPMATDTLSLPSGLNPGDFSVSSLPDLGSISAPSTPAASGAASPGFSLGTLTDFLGGITGGGGLNLAGAAGSAIPYAAIYGLANQAADKARAANQQTLKPLTDIASTLTGAGGKELSQFQGGTITPAQQGVADLAMQQGQTLLTSATPFQDISSTLLKQYQSGTLQQADQQALDQQITNQKQRVAQQLSNAGITDSTALNNAYQQIDQWAGQQRQSILNGYLSTGNQEYNQWMTSTQAGQQLQLESKTYVANSVQQHLTNALALDEAGMQPLGQAITATLASDTQISTSMTQLMASLASAWAYQQAQASGAGGAGTAGAGGAGGAAGAAGTVGKAVNAIKGLMGGGTPAAAGAIPTGLGAGGALGAGAAADALAAGGDTAAGILAGGIPGDISGMAIPGLEAASPAAASASEFALAQPAVDAYTAEATGAGAAPAAGGLGAAASLALPVGMFGGLMLASQNAKTDVIRNPLTGGTTTSKDPFYSTLTQYMEPSQAKQQVGEMPMMDPTAAGAMGSAFASSPTFQAGTPEQMAQWFNQTPQAGMEAQASAMPQMTQQQLVQAYLAQGGDPKSLLPQYQQYVPKG